MPTISLRTEIKAPIKVCFNLARSIDFHMVSTESSGEKAVAGRLTGLIGLNETVTWRAKHLGVWQELTSRITAFKEPEFFVDEMTKGAFKSIWHEHRFEQNGDTTVMTDTFRFESPFGIAGKIFNNIFLTAYLKRLISGRNALLKEYAETGKWRGLGGLRSESIF